MKSRILYICLMSCLPVLFTACGDFLEEKSQNLAYVEKVADLNELLIGEGYLSGGNSIDTLNAASVNKWGSIWNMNAVTGKMPVNNFPYIHLMDDDATEYLLCEKSIVNTEKNYIRMKAINLHHWQPDPFYDSENAEINDGNWQNMWKRIAAMNSVIYQVNEMRGKEDDKVLCNKVEGEARFLRAQYYFYMANLYGKPYRKASASIDPCIPLKTSEEIEDKYFSRATCEEVYRQVVKDLEQATVLLQGIEQTTKYRTNQTAAFALLSRVHLFMENYEAAVAAADSVIGNPDYYLRDLKAYQRGSAVYVTSPEVIFTHGPNIMAVVHAPVVVSGSGVNQQRISSGYTTSEDLLACYGENDNDMRLKAFFIERPAPGNGWRCVKTQFTAEEVSDIMAIRVPEVYLNKAEALALLGRDAEAIEVLNELREKRLKVAGAVTESGEGLVNFIRDERRRELCFEGHRWFDLRRYAVNSVYPYEKEIRHISYDFLEGSGVYRVGTYVLKPYSQDAAAYMLPIPRYAIEFNEGTLTNEVRPSREIVVE